MLFNRYFSSIESVLVIHFTFQNTHIHYFGELLFVLVIALTLCWVYFWTLLLFFIISFFILTIFLILSHLIIYITVVKKIAEIQSCIISCLEKVVSWWVIQHFTKKTWFFIVVIVKKIRKKALLLFSLLILIVCW